MPIYDYKCNDCNSVIEKRQNFNDPPLNSCPYCGGKLTKIIGVPAILFKGSGFYVTDNIKTVPTKK